MVYSAQASHPSQKVAIGNRKSMIAKINGTASALPRVQESAILLLGEFARLAKEEDLGDLLEPLIVRLGSAGAPLRSAAYTQVSVTNGPELNVDPRYQSIKGEGTLQPDFTSYGAYSCITRQEYRQASRYCRRDHVVDWLYSKSVLHHYSPLHHPRSSHDFRSSSSGIDIVNSRLSTRIPPFRSRRIDLIEIVPL